MDRPDHNRIRCGSHASKQAHTPVSAARATHEDDTQSAFCYPLLGSSRHAEMRAAPFGRRVAKMQREHVPDAHQAARRLVAGPDEFAAVFDEHFAAVHRYLHRRAGVELADEVAAETFLVAFEQRRRFVASDDLGVLPWLYGIATNLLRRRWRAERRQLRAYARTGVDAAVALDTDASVSRADADRRGRQIAAALAKLRADDRDVFLLITLAGLSQAETAKALQLPIGTVATRARRARGLLAGELTPEPAPKELLADA